MGTTGDKQTEWIKPVSEGQMSMISLTCDLKFCIVTQSQYVYAKGK